MPDYEIHELMICRIAAEMNESGVTLLGSFTPLAYAAYMLAKLTHAPDAWLCGYNAVGIQPVELNFTSTEAAIYRRSVCRWSFPETIHVVHLGMRGLLECVSPAQIDGDGAINLSVIGDYANPKVRLPGGAGSPEVVQNYRTVVAYFGHHDRRTLVEKVDFATGRRYPISATERQARGLPVGPVLIVTPLAVLRKDEDDEPFSLESVSPGVGVEQVLGNTAFPVRVPADVPETPIPTDQQLDLLRNKIDPFGTAKFDFLPSRERLAYLRQSLSREWERGERLARLADHERT